jgi:hypothetical protein
MRARGVLERRPMFSEILEDGVRWADGTTLRADVILWCTGFRSALDHLAPLDLREANGGIVMTGRLATQVAKDPRIHLVGYGPSASTIGANRAGAAAATELMAYLGLRECASARVRGCERHSSYDDSAMSYAAMEFTTSSAA